MKQKHVWITLVGIGLLGGMAAVAQSAPWDKLLTLNRVEADPNLSYNLSDQNGPWMIMACSFSGELAEQQAKDLVLELRQRYKLPAYVYRKRFELGEDAPGRGWDRYGAPLRMQYRSGSEVDEFAVLVGDYPAVDDAEGQETLRRLKYYQPETLKLENGKSTTRTLAGWRLIQQTVLAPGNEKKNKGPMGHAFITTNPLLPKDYFVPKGVDKFLLALNEGYEYNLLNCPGKYTVQVAHFTGGVVIDQKKIGEIEQGRTRMKSHLVEAAEKAHKLTQALRQKGYEAYEFHDRYASIVAVGSFDSAGTPRPDGKIEINPQLHAIMKTFGADSGPVPGSVNRKELVGIPFDLQPIPVEVPKRSIAADYARDATR